MPSYVMPIIFFSATAAIAALSSIVLATTKQLGASAYRHIGVLVLLVLLAWFAVATGLSLQGTYVASPNGLPTIQFGIIGPIVLGLLAYRWLPKLRQVLTAIPQPWLIGVQVYRAGGALFVVLWGMGLLPGEFAGPAGYGDLLVGVLAPLVAWLWASNHAGRRIAALWWNALGLVDLALALTLGFVTTPSRFQLLAQDHSSLLVTQFPLVFIPTFIVPLSILLHLASLAKLRAEPT